MQGQGALLIMTAVRFFLPILIAGQLLGCLPAALGALEQDPLFHKSVLPLKEGQLAFGAQARQVNRLAWIDSNKVPHYMLDLDGLTKSVKGFQFELMSQWRLSPALALEAALPYQYKEFSQGLSYRLDDPTVRRGDGVGDLRLGARHAWIQGRAFRLGARAGVVVPTGLSPFASQHGLMGAGGGSFQFEAGLAAEGRLSEAFELWLGASGFADLGAGADIAPGAFKGMDGAGGIATFAGGREFVRRQPGASAVAGLGYEWHRDEQAAHWIGFEAAWRMEGELEVAGQGVPDTRNWTLELLPQARFGFGRFGLSAGWVLPMRLAANQPVSFDGELLLRADFIP